MYALSRKLVDMVTATTIVFSLAVSPAYAQFGTPSSSQESLDELRRYRGDGDNPPPSALVNQRSEETLNAARAASPQTAESTYAYFQDEAEASIARAIERVWDPTLPHPEPPRTPWGDPELNGYWENVAYTPLERPEALAGKPLYTHQEAIEAFQQITSSMASLRR